MSLLDGGLQQMFGAAFGAVLLDGRHYHKRQDFGSGGDVTRAVIETQSIKGYREVTNDFMRSQGFTDKDARLIVLQTYAGRVVTAPERGDTIKIDGITWVCGDITEDAAHTHWIIRSTRE